jgi:hypothetical protein
MAKAPPPPVTAQRKSPATSKRNGGAPRRVPRVEPGVEKLDSGGEIQVYRAKAPMRPRPREA